MDLAHANLIRSSISALRALKLANPADERVRLETIEKLTRSLDGIQFEFCDERVFQAEIFGGRKV